MVTLAGQLIDTSGTMSGGGAAAQRGGMAGAIVEAISEKDIKAAEVITCLCVVVIVAVLLTCVCCVLFCL